MTNIMLTQQMKIPILIVALRANYSALEPAHFLNVAHLFVVKVHKETDAYSIRLVKHKTLTKDPDNFMKNFKCISRLQMIDN